MKVKDIAGLLLAIAGIFILVKFAISREFNSTSVFIWKFSIVIYYLGLIAGEMEKK